MANAGYAMAWQKSGSLFLVGTGKWMEGATNLETESPFLGDPQFGFHVILEGGVLLD